MNAICRKLSWFNNGSGSKRLVSIEGFTELQLLSTETQSTRSIVRAHPDYRGNGPWMDWVNVCWEHVTDIGEEESLSEIILPARVIMLLDFNTAKYAAIPEEVVSQFTCYNQFLERRAHDIREGIHVMVHSASMPLEMQLDEDESDIQYDGSVVSQRYDMEEVYQFVQVENIKGIAFVAIDPPENIATNCKNQYCHELCYKITQVHNPVAWGSSFENKFSKKYKQPALKNLCHDEFNESFNPW